MFYWNLLMLIELQAETDKEAGRKMTMERMKALQNRNWKVLMDAYNQNEDKMNWMAEVWGEMN